MMTIPTKAALECDLGDGVALYDVSRLLVRTKREQMRDPSLIARVFHHHSGAMGHPRFAGLDASARFVVQKRGFPGPAYTFWLAYEPDVDDAGRLVVYRANRDGVVSWATGGVNETSISIAWQGNLSIVEPSKAQLRMAERLARYLAVRHPGIEHSFHAEAKLYGGRSKKTCPGPHVTAWVRTWRGDAKAVA